MTGLWMSDLWTDLCVFLFLWDKYNIWGLGKLPSRFQKICKPRKCDCERTVPKTVRIKLEVQEVGEDRNFVHVKKARSYEWSLSKEKPQELQPVLYCRNRIIQILWSSVLRVTTCLGNWMQNYLTGLLSCFGSTFISLFFCFGMKVLILGHWMLHCLTSFFSFSGLTSGFALFFREDVELGVFSTAETVKTSESGVNVFRIKRYTWVFQDADIKCYDFYLDVPPSLLHSTYSQQGLVESDYTIGLLELV